MTRIADAEKAERKKEAVERVVRWRWYYTVMPTLMGGLAYWSYRLGYWHGRGSQRMVFLSESFGAVVGCWQAVYVWWLTYHQPAVPSATLAEVEDAASWPPPPKRLT